MKSIIKYILLSAVRDLLFVAIILAMIFVCFMSVMLADLALSEAQLALMTYLAGILRVIGTVGMILFVSFHISKSHDNQYLALLMSRPISRMQFVLSYFVGLAILCLVITALISFILFVLGNASLTSLAIWSFSCLIEMLIMASFAFTVTVVLYSAVLSSMASLAFYLLARLMGFCYASFASKAVTQFTNVKQGAMWVLQKAFTGIYALVPRLDLFGQTEWLVYGISNPTEIIILVSQSVIYIAILFFMSLFDIKRKQF